MEGAGAKGMRPGLRQLVRELSCDGDKGALTCLEVRLEGQHGSDHLLECRLVRLCQNRLLTDPRHGQSRRCQPQRERPTNHEQREGTKQGGGASRLPLRWLGPPPKVRTYRRDGVERRGYREDGVAGEGVVDDAQVGVRRQQRHTVRPHRAATHQTAAGLGVGPEKRLTRDARSEPARTSPQLIQ